MLAVVDADGKFIMVDIGGAGRQSDSSLYNNSEVSFIENLWYLCQGCQQHFFKINKFDFKNQILGAKIIGKMLIFHYFL